MIFRREEYLRSQRDERFPLVDLEFGGKAWHRQADSGGTGPADSAGRFPARAARFPRELSQSLGCGLDRVCGFAPARAFVRGENSRTIRPGGGAGFVYAGRRTSRRRGSGLHAQPRSDCSFDGDHARPGRLCRRPSSVVARFPARARGRGSWLPGHSLNGFDCSAARTPRTLGALGMAARSLPAHTSSCLGTSHRPRTHVRILCRRACARCVDAVGRH